MIPIISFIGSSGSGKTSILEKIVVELTKRGLRVAVIKHSHHDALSFDKKGKDSQRYTTAGAEAVIVSGPQEIVFMKKTDHDLLLNEITRLIDPDIDLILTEGFKNADTFKVEVHRKALESKLLAKPNQLLAVVTDEKLDVKVPQFDITKDNTIKIADLIEKWLAAQPKKRLQLIVNQKFVETNPFVKDFISSTMEGMVSSLKGVNNIKSLQITLIK